MTMEIDIDAFKFVEKLTVKEFPKKESNKKESESKLKGLGNVISLGEVKNFGLEEFDEDTYLTKRKFKDIDGKLVGLDTNEYAEFKEFIDCIFNQEYFSKKSDFQTLFDISLEWVLDVYKTKKANSNLTSFLIDKINSLTHEYHFFFKIKALAIENAIVIGNTELMFFTEEKLEEFYKKTIETNPERTFDDFKKNYKGNFDAINAFVKVKGVKNRAEEIAFKEAELSIDVLKCFCTYYSTEKPVQMFELDYRFHPNSSSNYLYMPDGDFKEATFQISNFGGVVPIQLTSNFLEQLKTKHIDQFSTFLLDKKETELYFATLDLIKQLSIIISTHNNYEKVVKAISLFESICVPKESTQAKGETYLKKKVVPKLFSKHDTQTLNKLIRKHYEIRDKYLHNYIHLPLNKKDLGIFLEYQRYFILEIIKLNKKFEYIDQLLNYFEI